MEEKPHARKPNSDDAIAPKKRFRWVCFMLGAVLLCLLLIGWFSILPRFAEQRVIDALKELGFEQVSLQVDEVGLDEARISHIRLGGKNPVVIGKITTRYKLGEAMDGRLGTVDIEGLKLNAVLGANRVSFPQLENLNLSAEPMDRLPFDEIRIRSAKLFFEDSFDASHIIQVEAKLTRIEPKAIAVQLFAQEKSLALTADVSVGGETLEVAGGLLTLECQELPVPGLSQPLHDVFLKLNFAGNISTEEITLVLKTGSDVSAGLSKLSFGDRVDVSRMRLAGKIVDPLTLESTMDGFNVKGVEGQVQGRLEAQTMNWQKNDMRHMNNT